MENLYHDYLTLLDAKIAPTSSTYINASNKEEIIKIIEILKDIRNDTLDDLNYKHRAEFQTLISELKKHKKRELRAMTAGELIDFAPENIRTKLNKLLITESFALAAKNKLIDNQEKQP